MNRLLLIIALCFIQASHGQKWVHKSILDSDVQLVQIDATSLSKIVLKTESTQEMVVEAKFEGEYKNAMVLGMVKEGTTLRIAPKLNPEFSFPNDKLSAHKVLSVELKVTLPQYSAIEVFGNSVRVQAQGQYETLTVKLNDGMCSLKNIKGWVQVNTQNGNIYFDGLRAKIYAHSSYGKVLGNIPEDQEIQLKLTSVTGDIHLGKTE